MNDKVNHGRLQVEVGDSVAWEGTFYDGEVIIAMGLPGTEDCIVLLENLEMGADRNLLRVSPDRRVKWRADVAPEGGSYTDVQLQDGLIVAWSWSGYRVKLDSESGKIVEKIR